MLPIILSEYGLFVNTNFDTHLVQKQSSARRHRRDHIASAETAVHRVQVAATSRHLHTDANHLSDLMEHETLTLQSHTQIQFIVDTNGIAHGDTQQVTLRRGIRCSLPNRVVVEIVGPNEE